MNWRQGSGTCKIASTAVHPVLKMFRPSLFSCVWPLGSIDGLWSILLLCCVGPSREACLWLRSWMACLGHPCSVGGTGLCYLRNQTSFIPLFLIDALLIVHNFIGGLLQFCRDLSLLCLLVSELRILMRGLGMIACPSCSIWMSPLMFLLDSGRSTRSSDFCGEQRRPQALVYWFMVSVALWSGS